MAYKKRTVKYEVCIECRSDYMEELADGFFKIALYAVGRYLGEKGYNHTKISFTKK